MSTQHLREIINYGSHEAIKHWLKISGHHPYTAGNEADFYKLLERHIGSGKVRIDQLRVVALEIEEYGGKRIYLGKLSDYKTIGLRQRFENHIKSLGLGLSPEPIVPRELPSKPHLNYICWSTKEVRIGYSETHEVIKPNRANMTLDSVLRTNLCESGVEMTDKPAELVECSCDGDSTDSTVSACLSRLRYPLSDLFSTPEQ